MGEARRRGTYEQRKEEAEFYASEQARYDEWLKRRRPRWLAKIQDSRFYSTEMMEILAALVWAKRKRPLQ